MVYSYAVEDNEDQAKVRERVDEYLTSLNTPARETWGRLPSQQRAMARAQRLGGGGS